MPINRAFLHQARLCPRQLSTILHTAGSIRFGQSVYCIIVLVKYTLEHNNFTNITFLQGRSICGKRKFRWLKVVTESFTSLCLSRCLGMTDHLVSHIWQRGHLRRIGDSFTRQIVAFASSIPPSANLVEGPHEIQYSRYIDLRRPYKSG